MSQIEHDFRMFLAKRPEIEKAYAEGLINRRALARYLIKEGIAKSNEIEAAVAMLRRHDFKKADADAKIGEFRTTMKDSILVLDFEKNKELLKKLDKVIANTDYDKGDTLKIVVGSSSIKVFIDEENEKKIKDIIEQHKVKSRLSNISEISLQFGEKARASKGIIALIARELSLNDIAITEMLTCSPELILYIKEEHVLKAMEIIKDI